jgi:predicted DNA-binding protein (UPF0251 family)
MAAKVVETVILKEPITLLMKPAGGEEREETIAALEIHEFKAKDLRAMDGLKDTDKASILLALVARITRQPIRVIDELGIEDFQLIGDKVSAFLPDGLKTGATP